MQRSITRKLHAICLVVVLCDSAVAQADRFPDLAEIKALVAKCETHISLVQLLQPDIVKWAEIMDTKTQQEWLAPALNYLMDLAAVRTKDERSLAAFRVRLAAGIYAAALRIDRTSYATEIRARLIRWLVDAGFASHLTLETMQVIEVAYSADGSCGTK